VALPFQYRDGWFYSVGAEYALDPKVTLRAGVAYEVTPITDQVRMPILPDNDRVWLSASFSYKVLPNLITDVGYSHIWVKDANINISPRPEIRGSSRQSVTSAIRRPASISFRSAFATCSMRRRRPSGRS
jgi:long-chain fatty acid transport protein